MTTTIKSKKRQREKQREIELRCKKTNSEELRGQELRGYRTIMTFTFEAIQVFSLKAPANLEQEGEKIGRVVALLVESGDSNIKANEF